LARFCLIIWQCLMGCDKVLTTMAEKVTPRSKDFSEWYQDVVLRSQLADYSPVKGCMVIRPNGYAIWEKIQRDFDARIKKAGVRNAYFPIFIPESFLKKEAEHVEGFAPQCAVVTYAGAKDLEEKLVVRPTSETIINSMFSKWIQSYRDLPLLINQWANVVRWEMRTRLFLRTTEFLWQEGHTCHATAEESEEFTRKMLGVYTEFAEQVLAMPVIPGLKTDSERFAGALRTYSIEAMMQDKKALQAGTSHNLSTNFANAFSTKFLDKDGKEKLVHQTSWGVSTRLIGGMVMTHSDDKGLVLPPRLASTHVVIIPIFGKDPTVKPKVMELAQQISNSIIQDGHSSGLPYDVEVKIDDDDSKSMGWKCHEYELIGIPIRIEIGPKDIEKNQAVLSRRDLDQKEFVSLDSISKKAVAHLRAMQFELLEKARKYRDANTFVTNQYSEFVKKNEENGGFFVAPWCRSAQCEEKIKVETKATIRCIPLDQNYQPHAEAAGCMVCGKKENSIRVVVARAY
jgi:prolyl-tRNA synthetase